MQRGDGKVGTGSTTHLRMRHFTFSGLGESAILPAGERPEIVNIKFSSAGSKPVPPEWPDKGSHHFLRNKIHLSCELRPTREAELSTKPPPQAAHTGFWSKSQDTTWGSGKFSLFLKWGTQLLYSSFKVPPRKVSDLNAQISTET